VKCGVEAHSRFKRVMRMVTAVVEYVEVKYDQASSDWRHTVRSRAGLKQEDKTKFASKTFPAYWNACRAVDTTEGIGGC
jgi:hypothetical protein